MPEGIKGRVEQFIHSGESLANEVNAFRKQIKSIGEELTRDF
jgi:hypothetical protein